MKQDGLEVAIDIYALMTTTRSLSRRSIMSACRCCYERWCNTRTAKRLCLA